MSQPPSGVQSNNPSQLWQDTIVQAASLNVPSVWQRIRDSPFLPASIAFAATMLILWLVQPWFVQRKQSSKIALPSLSWTTIVGVSCLAFVLVLVIPRILQRYAA